MKNGDTDMDDPYMIRKPISLALNRSAAVVRTAAASHSTKPIDNKSDSDDDSSQGSITKR